MAEKFEADININSNIDKTLEKAEKLDQILDSATKKASEFELTSKTFYDSKTKKDVTIPAIKSDAFYGQVNQWGNGYLGKGEVLTASDLARMYKNNNPSKTGQTDVREIIKQALQYLQSFVPDVSNYEAYNGENSSKKVPAYVKGAQKRVMTGHDEETGKPIYQSTSSVYTSKQESQAEAMIRSLDKQSEVFNDKIIDKMLTNIKVSFEQNKKKIFEKLNEELLSANFLTEQGIEKGDNGLGTGMSNISQTRFEKNREQQSEREARYVGYNNPDYDDKYETEQVRRFEALARKEGYQNRKVSDIATQVRQDAQGNPLKEFENDYTKESISNIFKNLVRFLTEGKLIESNPEIDKSLSLNPTMQKKVSSLKDISSFVLGDKDLKKYFTFDSLSQEEQSTLKQNLPQALETLSSRLIEYAQNNRSNLDSKVYTQLLQRIVEIQKVLGTFDLQKSNGIEEKDLLSSDASRVWFNQTQKHIPLGGRNEYEADAVRSFLSKQGIEQPGNFPTATFPQYLKGELPYLPNNPDNYYDGGEKDWENDEKKMSRRQTQWESDKRVDSVNALAKKVRFLAKKANNSTGEEKSKIEEALNVLEKDLTQAYEDLTAEQKKQANISGLAQGENGLFKPIKDFTEKDFNARLQKIQGAVQNNNLSQEENRQLLDYLDEMRSFIGEKSKEELELTPIQEQQKKGIKRILGDFSQEDFTKEELQEYGEWDKKFKLDLSQIPFSENGSISREELKKYQESIVANKQKDYEKILQNINYLQADLDEQFYDQKLMPYIEEYSKADSSAAKGIVTKKVKAEFGEESQEYIYYKEQKSNLLEKLKIKQEKEAEEAKNAIALQKEEEKAQVRTLEEMTKGEDYISEAPERGKNGYLDNLVKKIGKKEYSGPGIELNGQSYYLTELKKEFELDSNNTQKTNMLSQLQNLYQGFSSEQQEWFLAELQNPKKWNQNGKQIELNALADSFLQQMQGTEGFSERLERAKLYTVNEKGIMIAPSEKQEVEESNQALEEHEIKVNNAIEAEQGKLLISEKLANALNEETTAIQSNNQALEQHNQDITLEGFTPQFDKESHQYTDENGNKIYSSTQLRDLLLSKSNPSFKEDLRRLNVAANSHNADNPLTASEMGMSQSSYDFMTKNVIGSGVRGDLFHSLVDKMIKSNSSTLDQLEQNDQKAFQEYQEEYKKAVDTLAKFGIGEEFLGISDRISSYMDALNKSGLTPTQFSEQQLGFRLKGERGDIAVGVTPDQLFSMGNGGGALIDNKTGNVKGYEAFQLTAQKLGLLANADKYESEMGDVADLSNIKAYIADVKDGITELIEYQLLSLKEFYNLAADAQEIGEGKREGLSNEEIKSRMNRQLQTGRIIGVSDNIQGEREDIREIGTGEYISSQKLESSKIREYVSQYQKVVNAETELIKLQQQLNSLQSTGSEKEIEKKQEAVQEAQNYLDILQTGLNKLGSYEEDSGLYGMLGNIVLSKDGGEKIKQKIDEINQKAQLSRAKNAYSQTKADEKNSGINSQSSTSLMNQYLKNYEQQLILQRNMQRTELQMDSASGQKKKDLQQLNQAYEQQLINLKKQAPIFDEEARTLNGIQLTDEQILELRQKQNTIALNHESLQAKINAQQRESKGLIQQIGEGFKASFRNLVDYSMAYQIIGLIRQAYTELINTTKQLDSAMVDLQIASGNTKEEVKDMLKDFSDLGDELGRTTQEVASAANDWLRAGFESAEAAELTKASMQLSTLGMIESADSTSYLISMLKGWKLEVEDVTSVVDKLVAVDMSAAISAGDLAEALSRANVSAQLAGSGMDEYIGYVTTVSDVTQKSASSIGES